MTEQAPPWLATMRAITGIKETPGEASNPKIMGMVDYIADKFPEQRSYCDLYTDDSVPWCGLTVAYCMATTDIPGPFGPTDTDKWMWAESFASDPGYVRISQPVPGCLVYKERDGGGHITLYERTENGSYVCRGGNQSDSVNLASYPISDIKALMWPKDYPMPDVPPRTISEGDSGPDVMDVQRILGLPIDGDFGPVTDKGVKQYQGAYGLSKDGEVGPMTWDALHELDDKMADGTDGISDELAAAIDEIVDKAKPVLNYSWKDRGKAPVGYYHGMAKAFAYALQHMSAPAVGVMSEKVSDSDYDALNVYEDDLNDEGLYVTKDGMDTLRALYTMMIGLGMRESSGNHWCGRDLSADNVESDTAEAGLFQTSWNIASADPSIPPLLTDFWEDPNGFRPSFDEGVSPTSGDLDAFGSGDGARYQFLAKYSPNFHVLVTGVGMRKRSNHWGPINRGEVEIVGIVADMLLDVEDLVMGQPDPGPDPGPDPEPEPEPGTPEVTVTIATKGDVEVHVVQEQSTKRAAQAAEPEPKEEKTMATKPVAKRQARKASRAAKNGTRKKTRRKK